MLVVHNHPGYWRAIGFVLIFLAGAALGTVTPAPVNNRFARFELWPRVKRPAFTCFGALLGLLVFALLGRKLFKMDQGAAIELEFHYNAKDTITFGDPRS